jgi:hypothetical protein
VVGRRSRYASTLSNTRGSPLCWTGGARLDLLAVEHAVSVKIFVAILLIAAVPAYAQAQSRSTPKVTKGDAQKVATIIRSDKAKTQTYCEINKISDQMNQAYGKNDTKTVDELSQKIDRLEKILGSEYIALMDGLQKLGPENKKRVAEIMSQFAALDRLCAR